MGKGLGNLDMVVEGLVEHSDSCYTEHDHSLFV